MANTSLKDIFNYFTPFEKIIQLCY